MLAVRGGSADCAQIQLMAPLDDSSTIAKFIDKRGAGIQQMAYRVSDLDALSEELRSRGVRLIYDAPRRGTANSRINFIHPRTPAASWWNSSSTPPTTKPVRTTCGSVRGWRGWPSTAYANAGGRPLPLPAFRPPDHHMGRAGTDLVITTGTAIRLHRPHTRHRTHLVVVAVGADLDTPRNRQRRRNIPRPAPGASPTAHQNSRNSLLSMPRIMS